MIILIGAQTGERSTFERYRKHNPTGSIKRKATAESDILRGEGEGSSSFSMLLYWRMALCIG